MLGSITISQLIHSLEANKRIRTDITIVEYGNKKFLINKVKKRVSEKKTTSLPILSYFSSFL